MAQVKCAISGIPYQVPHIPLVLSKRELAHPIFYASQEQLLSLYEKYNAGHLTPTDNYLLFLALLYSTDNITFYTSCSLSPTSPHTQAIVANNITQLVSVIWQTGAILHPAFKQPHYVIRKDTADLSTIHNWIKSWKLNIQDFKLGIAHLNEVHELVALENKLLALVRKGIENASLASVVAEWADKAACFPGHKAELYKKTIRKCFNPASMFSTPKELIIEIKHYCEENIEATATHFHTLMTTLHTGYRYHSNYLGTNTLESLTSSGSIPTFTICPKDSSVEEANLLDIIAKAPKKEPVRSQYPNQVAYIQAKLRYRTAHKASQNSKEQEK